MNISALRQEFILHFGEMGSRWGINRTVGQVYALLFLADDPLCADEIVAALGFSRSNVSMALKELQSWNLVRLRHRPDDRREFFATPDDLWEIVRTLIAERRKREIDPTLTKLRELSMTEPDAADAAAHARIAELRELIEQMTRFHDDLARFETERLIALLSMGAKLGRIVDGAGRLIPIRRQKP
ncbi:GbsR/MarR family transcriptional regulator [Paracoccus aestuarii]|uniref:HTH-type transcriptional regulator n=1 Tax=Paracoccus aestuarii TaxID=453842 RepID=A0A418ZW69_9RHOB|nr:GbsR/MarR family transcriptional regulator [Paracoccus aestuarii]RJL04739.1 GbsR/MarR family transcriptional regulator [Paracoccus aestuarii]WCQ97971.1 GbsR/MarR family transcriptional regulator [Paracoccus aestuarii]